jgi:Putative DNA-binding domain
VTARIIDSTASLPAIGSVEDDALDFKREAARDAGEFDQIEMAKDIAALANGVGGTLLIGANEVDHRLASYQPMALDVVSQVEQVYGQALSKRCVPTPSARITRVEKDDGFVLAINVSAYLPGPIGVLRKGAETADRGPKHASKPSFMFPVRRGVHTSYLDPGQLAMIQLPELRRAVMMLNLIPPEAAVCLQDQHGHRPSCRIKSTDIDANTIRLQCQAPQGNTVEFTMPVSDIRVVWKTEDGRWTAAVTGKISMLNNSVFYGP